jgi:large conductance mechanosensitive channel
MSVIKEFREFAMRGNMVDMAVGIIIGGAFGIIIKSLIDDVIMPIVGIAGKADFSNLYIALTPRTAEAIEARETIEGVRTLALAQAREMGPVLAWGNFVTVLFNFLILAFAVFMMIRAMNTAKRRFERQQEAAPPTAPGQDIMLLSEIRDLLKART